MENKNKLTKTKAKKLISELYRDYEVEGTNCDAYQELEKLGITEHYSFHSIIADIIEKYRNPRWCTLSSLVEDLLIMSH